MIGKIIELSEKNTTYGQYGRKPIRYYVGESGCWVVTSHRDNGNGYPLVSRNGRQELMSRFIYKRFNGKLGRFVVRHTCDNRKCINPEHLIKGTRKQNSADMVARHRHQLGAARPNAKLNDEKVRAIRKLFSTKTNHEIAILFNITRAPIRAIRIGKTWKHVL